MRALDKFKEILRVMSLVKVTVFYAVKNKVNKKNFPSSL